VPPVKSLALIVSLAFSSLALGDNAKTPAPANKLGSEARVFVVDKEVPSLDKTVPLQHARLATKNK
jgi:hypothetical protein